MASAGALVGASALVVGVRRRFRPWAGADLASLPIPRVWVQLAPGGEGEDDLLLIGVELCSRYGDPVLHFGVDIRWNRPRPWQLDVECPPKFGRRRLRWTAPS